MTDNEIIKVFEEHIERTKNIKYGARKMAMVDVKLLKNALDLINRQQAEIERAKEINEQLYEEMSERQKEEVSIAKRMARKKAIKEFWSKLKTHSRKMQSSDFSGEFWDKAVLVEDGDNLVKEMVGADNEN